MCANLAKQTQLKPENAYTAGLLSTIDAFVDVPIEVLTQCFIESAKEASEIFSVLGMHNNS